MRSKVHFVAVSSGLCINEYFYMGHTICIVSLKGGVGKTATAVNLSLSLALLGKNTMLVDGDPQGSATTGVGIDKRRLKKTLYDVLMGKSRLEDTIVRAGINSLKVVPVRGELFRAEHELEASRDREKILSRLLLKHKKEYDYVVIDTPPSLSLISVNGIAAADSILIPLQCEYPAYESFVQLLRFIDYAKQKLNPDLRISGVLLTMRDAGEKISDRIVQNIRTRLGQKVFDAVIPRDAGLRESSATGKPLPLYYPESVGAKRYMELAKEVVERTREFREARNQTIESKETKK